MNFALIFLVNLNNWKWINLLLAKSGSLITQPTNGGLVNDYENFLHQGQVIDETADAYTVTDDDNNKYQIDKKKAMEVEASCLGKNVEFFN